ncbi:hypothetical protein [Halosimplex sp. TS25]|uniref:DUF7286 family protein n=1 Tax=Halosimplex rarum TaxID=3396619 RepID=UPI0039E78E79
MTRDRPRTLTIASSDRARIPFSIVGVFLLVTSVSVVGYMETRPDPEPEVDVSTAIDQASATTQTVLRESTADAARKAAQEPVTVAADTPAGRALDSGSESVFKRYVKLRVYLEMRERLRAAQYTETGTTTRMSIPPIDYSESSVEEAIDTVTLTVGSDSGTPDVEDGTVKATVEDITYEVSREGEIIEEQTNDVTVTVSTTTFLIHDKVQSYQDSLKADFFGSTDYGFGKRFAARLYPLMYGKAYYERMAPRAQSGVFDKMVMKKELEVLANDANFALQRKTFGTQDPAADRVMLAAWSCVAARNAEKLYRNRNSGGNNNGGGNSGGNNGGSNNGGNNGGGSDDVGGDNTGTQGAGSVSDVYNNFGFGAKDFCKATKFLTGGASGQTPESIEAVLNQVIGQQAQQKLQEKSEIAIDKFADPALQEVRGEAIDFDAEYEDEANSEDPLASEEPETDVTLPDDFRNTDHLGDAVDRVFSYTATASADSASHTDGAFPEADPGGEWEKISSSGGISFVGNEEFDVQHEETWNGETGKTRQLHTYTITVRNKLEHSARFRREVECENENEEDPCYERQTFDDESTVEFKKTVTIGGTYSDDDTIKVDPFGIEEPYSGSGPNFEEALEKSVEEGLGVSGSSAGTVESDLESDISISSIKSAGGLDGQVDGKVTPETELDSDVFLSSGERSALESTLESEAESIYRHMIGQGGSGSPGDVDPIQVSSMEMATGDGVFSGLSDQVTTGRYVYFDTGSVYSTARKKALVEGRMEYYEAVHGWIDRVESARESSTNDVNEEISEGVDGSSNVLNDLLGEAGGFINNQGTTVTPGTFEDAGLTGDVEYSVDAAPTYLSVTPVMRGTSPAVRPEQAGPSEVADTTHAPMAVRKHNTFGHPGVPVIPWPSYWYLSIDYWNVKVTGEYGRFEVTASNDDPASPKSTTYVRQAQPVELEIQGQQRTVGSVDPIDFSSETGVVIPVPGGTVYPKPRFGVGDKQWKSEVYRNKCSGTWPHAGPDFMPSDVDFSSCGNLQEGGEYTIDTFLPNGGSGGSGVLSQFEVESDGDIELADGEMEGCNEDTFTDALDDTGEDRYEDANDDEQEEIVDTYCSLVKGSYKSMFVYVFDESDRSVADDWKGMVVLRDTERIKDTLEYLTWDGDNDGEPLGEEHDIQWFKPAVDENINHRTSGTRIPPHRAPGIVTRIETDEQLKLARVYGDEGNIKGSYLTRPRDARYRSTKTLVQDLALLDDSMIESNGAQYYPWADYTCLGKVNVPEDTLLSISYTSEITTGDIRALNNPAEPIESAEMWSSDGAVEGGTIQFEAPNGRDIADERWLPLGTIEDLNVDTSGMDFEDAWDSAEYDDSGTNTYPADGVCDAH